MVLLRIRMRQPYTAEEVQRAEAQAAAFLERAVPALDVWHSAALAELPNQWQGRRAGAFSMRYGDFAQGSIGSLSVPPAGLLPYQDTGLLAFHLSRKNEYGFLRLCTSENEVRLDFSPGVTQITSRGRRLGAARAEGQINCELCDDTGRAIGHYRRFVRWQFVDYVPVVVAGRVPGEIKSLQRKGDGLFRRTPQPAARNLAPSLTPEEHDWLLAVIGIELLRDLQQARSRA